MKAASNHLLCSRVCKYFRPKIVQFNSRNPAVKDYRLSEGWSVKRK